MKKLILAIVLITTVALSVHAQRNLESYLIGRWELSEVNISRDWIANHLEFFDDGTRIMVTDNLMGRLGRWSESFSWRISDGCVILTSPIGTAQILSIVELSRTTFTYEGEIVLLGTICATFTRRG